jgi:hypothetical protein
MPEHRHLTLLVLEANEVEDEGINHPEGQGILFVQEDTNKEAVDAGVLHFHDLEKGSTRVKHWDADLGDHASNDRCFAERAISCLTNGEQDTLEKSCGFVERLLDSHVEMVVDLLGFAKVISHSRQEDQIEESRSNGFFLFIFFFIFRKKENGEQFVCFVLFVVFTSVPFWH